MPIGCIVGLSNGVSRICQRRCIIALRRVLQVQRHIVVVCRHRPQRWRCAFGIELVSRLYATICAQFGLKIIENKQLLKCIDAKKNMDLAGVDTKGNI